MRTTPKNARVEAEVQAVRSLVEGLQPVSFTQEELDRLNDQGRYHAPRPIPFLGEYTPLGWVRVHTLLVGEAAMSLEAFGRRIHPAPYAYSVAERGEFHVYVNEFLPGAYLPLEEMYREKGKDDYGVSVAGG